MEPRIAYCSACDRPVRVLVTETATDWPSAEAPNADDIICLEHGETCTGALCPLFDVPSEKMKENLEAYRRQAEGSEP